MAYNTELAHRIRAVLSDQEGVSERKMFGGLCFLINNNMACGIVKDELMVRVDKAKYGEALQLPHAREMDFTGRPMRGMIYVGVEGIATDADLAEWVGRGLAFAASLPPK
jgi:TfoX/Sxy family transcriptional regulator of competence genes